MTSRWASVAVAAAATTAAHVLLLVLLVVMSPVTAEPPSSQEWVNDTCNQMVSWDPKRLVTNRACQASCRGTDDSVDTTYCEMEYVLETDNAYIYNATGCFESFAWGYVTPPDLDGLPEYEAHDFWDCMSTCQSLLDCAGWWWVRATASCHVRLVWAQEMLMHNRLEDPEAPVNVFCDQDVAAACRNGSMECEVCDGRMDCVWRSQQLISGYGWCDDPKRECLVTTPLPTADPVQEPENSGKSDSSLAVGIAGGAVGLGAIAAALKWYAHRANRDLDLESDTQRRYGESAMSVDADQYL